MPVTSAAEPLEKIINVHISLDVEQNMRFQADLHVGLAGPLWSPSWDPIGPLLGLWRPPCLYIYIYYTAAKIIYIYIYFYIASYTSSHSIGNSGSDHAALRCVLYVYIITYINKVGK